MISGMYEPEYYTVTGSQVAFPITFEFVNSDDIRATQTDQTTGVATELAPGTDFTIAGAILTTTAQRAVGDGLTVWMEMPFVQSSDYKNAGDLDLENIEDDYDITALERQLLLDATFRSIRAPIFSPLGAEGMELPPLQGGKLVGINGAGTGVEFFDQPDSGLMPSGQHRQVLQNFNGTTWSAVDKDFILVTDYGAAGDGSTDDTVTIQAALDTGKDVYFPAVDDPDTEYYKITAALILQEGQKIFGEGAKSIIRQVTTGTPWPNVIEASGKDNITVNNLHLFCGGLTSQHNDGCGIYLFDCDNANIENCIFENMRGHGILGDEVENCVIQNNIFINSTTEDEMTNGLTGSDIRLQDESHGNLITGNTCMSGNSNGIRIYARDTETCSGNRITGNRVINARGQGITLYRTDLLGGSVVGTIIADNIINNVTGMIKNSGGDGYDFGAGIYIQGAEYTTITGNRISNTHSGSPPGGFSGNLAYAAIACVNYGNIIVSNNSINTDDHFHGIMLNDGNQYGLADGRSIVSNNSIEEMGLSGIYVRFKSNVSLTGNSIFNTTENGILVINSALTPGENYVIANNIIRGTTLDGINVDYVNNLSCTGNTLEEITASSTEFDHVINAVMTGNMIRGGGTYGIYLHGACEDFICNSNFVADQANGIRSELYGLMVRDNAFDNNTKNYYDAGADFSAVRTLSDSATPSVKNGELFLTGATTTITGFSEGVVLQELHIRADHSLTIIGVAMVSGDTISFKMFEDGVWTQTGSVIA
jgi:parallel beta-helix repeat protein